MKDGVVYTDSVKTAGKTADVKVEKVLGAKCDEDIAIYEITGLDGEGRINPAAAEKISLEIGGGKARVFVKAHGEVKLSAEIIK